MEGDKQNWKKFRTNELNKSEICCCWDFVKLTWEMWRKKFHKQDFETNKFSQKFSFPDCDKSINFLFLDHILQISREFPNFILKNLSIRISKFRNSEKFPQAVFARFFMSEHKYLQKLIKLERYLNRTF